MPSQLSELVDPGVFFLLDLSPWDFCWMDRFPNLRNVTSQLSCLGFPVDPMDTWSLKKSAHPMKHCWLVVFISATKITSRFCFRVMFMKPAVIHSFQQGTNCFSNLPSCCREPTVRGCVFSRWMHVFRCSTSIDEKIRSTPFHVSRWSLGWWCF